ncbi:hypothetical protein [Paenibacillus chitinolyticus]|uniref:hypothetical protein n=1 Tax=Paenibacillus chitinolyticus TaxID=79263 RepID=UPI003672B17B
MLKVDKEEHSVGIMNQLVEVYQAILMNPCFELYEQNAERIDDLYEQLKHLHIRKEDKLLLAEIKILHDQVMNAILLEKTSLSREITEIEKRKQVSVQYSKLSNYSGSDSYFVDFKR